MTRNQKYYRRGKAKAREAAIEFQFMFAEGFPEDNPWAIFEWVEHFRKIGKRFGLLREFRENAII